MCGEAVDDSLNDDQFDPSALGELAGEVLSDLYRALSGHAPKSVRVYCEDDALLLLLRFDPVELAGAAEIDVEPLLDSTLMALPNMIASALQRRAGHTLYPGNLSVNAERGLAVFAFSALEDALEAPSRREPFAALTPSWTELGELEPPGR
jgi:hypothetical protein